MENCLTFVNFLCKLRHYFKKEPIKIKLAELAELIVVDYNQLIDFRNKYFLIDLNLYL